MARSYSVEFLPAAVKDLKRLQKKHPKALGTIKRAIDGLAVDPRPDGSRTLTGLSNAYRIRAGDYRVVYLVEDRKLVVCVVAAGDRRDVYERVRRRLGL